jgi:hypothetical protein
MFLRAVFPVALIIAASVPAFAAATPDDGGSLAQHGEPPRKHSILITYGEDACPESTGDDIVVCAQQPESERYRVPKDLREELKEEVFSGGGGSWGSKVEGYDDIARVTRPNGCSAVGTNGATGCASAALRQWHAERRALDQD